MQRLFVIITIVVAVVVIAIFVSRQAGLATKEIAKDHPLLREAFTLVAHRGGALEVPENTLVSFDHATKLDPRIWLELDVHLTSDRQLAVIHDATVDRTANGTGKVVEKTMAELKALDAAAKFAGPKGDYPYKGKKISIPTLQEVLARYPKTNIIVEIKPKDTEVLRLTMKAIEDAGMVQRVVLASQHEHLLKEAQKQFPEWAYNTGETEVRRQIMLTSIFLEPIAKFTGDFLMIPPKDGTIPVLTPRLLAETHRRLKKVFLWTINDEAQMREFMGQGIDGLITDSPTLLLNVAKASARL